MSATSFGVWKKLSCTPGHDRCVDLVVDLVPGLIPAPVPMPLPFDQPGRHRLQVQTLLIEPPNIPREADADLRRQRIEFERRAAFRQCRSILGVCREHHRQLHGLGAKDIWSDNDLRCQVKGHLPCSRRDPPVDLPVQPQRLLVPARRCRRHRRRLSIRAMPTDQCQGRCRPATRRSYEGCVRRSARTCRCPGVRIDRRADERFVATERGGTRRLRLRRAVASLAGGELLTAPAPGRPEPRFF